MKNLVLLIPFLLMVTGCKSKLDKCNGVCQKMEAEELAGCFDEPCRRMASEKLQSCKGLCWTVAGGKPANVGNPKPDAESACAKGTAAACVDAGGGYLLGRGVAKDDSKARELFLKGCDLGSAFGCETAGKLLREGRGGPADPETAQILLKRACDGDSYGACTSVGLAAIKRGDAATAVTLMKKACEGKEKLGCFGLGALYLHGNGVRKDEAQARAFLGKACQLGEKPACDKIFSLDNAALMNKIAGPPGRRPSAPAAKTKNFAHANYKLLPPNLSRKAGPLRPN